MHVCGKDIFCESDHEDMYAAIDALVDKLDRQILKHKERTSPSQRDRAQAPAYRTRITHCPSAGSRRPRSMKSMALPCSPNCCRSNVALDLDATSKKRVFEHAGLLFENTQQFRAARYSTACSRARTWVRPDWVMASRFRTAASKDCAMPSARSSG